jgi:hypothetical protein
MKESSDVQRASESAGAVRARQEQLASQLEEEARIIAARFDGPADLERVTLLPKRGQVVVQLLALGWHPD